MSVLALGRVRHRREEAASMVPSPPSGWGRGTWSPKCQRSVTVSGVQHAPRGGGWRACRVPSLARWGWAPTLLIASERGILYHAARVGSLSLPCVARRAF